MRRSQAIAMQNVPWTSRYMDWYVFHLHRWTDSRPNWRQLQRGTLGKSCAKVEATSHRQNVFLLERQRQAPFYIHGNHLHACSGESVVLYHFIEVCRNIRHTHRELQTKHLGSAILSIPLKMCSEEPIFVIKSSPSATSPDVHSAEGAVDLNRYKKRPFMSTAKWHLRWTATFARLFQEMNMNVPSCQLAATASIHSHTYITTGRRPVCPELHAIAMQNTVAWTSQLSSSHVLPIHRRSDSRPTWRQQANLARSSKQHLTSYGLLARTRRAGCPWAPFFNHSNIS